MNRIDTGIYVNLMSMADKGKQFCIGVAPIWKISFIEESIIKKILIGLDNRIERLPINFNQY